MLAVQLGLLVGEVGAGPLPAPQAGAGVQGKEGLQGQEARPLGTLGRRPLGLRRLDGRQRRVAYQRWVVLVLPARGRRGPAGERRRPGRGGRGMGGRRAHAVLVQQVLEVLQVGATWHVLVLLLPVLRLWEDRCRYLGGVAGLGRAGADVSTGGHGGGALERRGWGILVHPWALGGVVGGPARATRKDTALRAGQPGTAMQSREG